MGRVGGCLPSFGKDAGREVALAIANEVHLFSGWPQASFNDLDRELRSAGRILIGWHRVGNPAACVNPRDKSLCLGWTTGDMLLSAIDPIMRKGSILERTKALRAHGQATSPPLSTPAFT